MFKGYYFSDLSVTVLKLNTMPEQPLDKLQFSAGSVEILGMIKSFTAFMKKKPFVVCV